MDLPASILITIALLTVFLCFFVGLKYSEMSYFTRMRLMMTSFFFFIVAILSISFWQFTFVTLPFTIPAFIVGAIIGHVVGVRAANQRLRSEGPAHYMEHFAHVHVREFKKLTWWSLINFYSVMGAIILINLIGFTTVILQQDQTFAILTSAVGAFLLGTIAPYLVHLWSLRAKRSS
jgi:hypothetical protein